MTPTKLKRLARYARSSWRMRREYRTDQRLGRRHLGPDDGSALDVRLSPSALETQLTKDYHRVEKGLALRDPKRPFGLEVQHRLTALLPAARQQNVDPSVVAHAESALAALERWNDTGEIAEAIAPIRGQSDDDQDRRNVSNVIGRRRSVRDFSTAPVDKEAIARAVRLAGLTPSVCNRQPWQIILSTDRLTVNNILEHQNGNRGFREDVPCVGVITVDRRLFSGAYERNQPWIEGGLFAMTLTLALEEAGFGTCLLNMSRSHADLRRLRRTLNLGDESAIVMMMAIGHPSMEHRIARSPRRDLDSVLRWV